MRVHLRAPVLMAFVVAGFHSAGAQEAADPWKDPDFQKQFVGTYATLSEMEPRISPEERTLLESIIPLMSSDLPAAGAQLAAATTGSSSALLDFTLGNVLFQQDRLEEAASSYQAAVSKFPSFRRAHKNLGLVSVRLGRSAEAVRAFTRMMELGGGDALTYGFLGQAQAAEGQFLSAESAYRQALLLQPASVDWKVGLARALFKQQRFEEAAALTGELIEAYPERTEFWQLQANAWLGAHQPMKAAQNLEVLARLGKANADMMTTLGDLYVNESLLDLAARAYGRAIELDPQASVSRPLRAAELLASRGGLEQSKALLDAVGQVYEGRLDEPERRKVLKLKARVAVAEGATAETVKALEEIVSLDPLDGEALLLLGRHSAQIGEPDRASLYFERAEGLEAFESEARLRHAQVLVGQARYAEALPLLKRAQEMKPSEQIARYLEQVERAARSRR